jgi:hypothetical protein
MSEAISQTEPNRFSPRSSECSRRSFALENVGLSRRATSLLWLVLPLTLVLAVTRQSLWTDEGFTIWFASHNSASSFFSTLVGSRGAAGDSQILFYLVYMWAWVKVFGASEVALRAANIPFAIVFIGAMAWASRRLLQLPKLWALFCLSPFFWFYLNEARPYVALLAFSGAATVALLAYLIRPAEYRAAAPSVCLTTLLFAWGIHITAAFLFPSFLVLIAARLVTEPYLRHNFIKDWLKPALLCSPAFIALGVFYLRTSEYGINRYGKSGLASLSYVLYEFAGFQGLGPPRNDIRSRPDLSIFLPYWPFLLAGIAVFLGFGILLARSRPDKVTLSLLACLLVGISIAVKISMIEDFQILGRHMAAFFPLVLITLMLWLRPRFIATAKRSASIVVLTMVGLVWAISDARLVFLNKYEKDAYRDACAIALAKVRSDHGKILWAADPHTAYYYGIQVTSSRSILGLPNHDESVHYPAVDARNWNAREARAYLDSSNSPVILVLGKADAFDANDAWPLLIRERNPNELARLPAFMIYEWAAAPPATISTGKTTPET